METAHEIRVSPHWLRLRERADAAARAAELVEPILRRLSGAQRIVVHDLGCGTGSMARWLAPRLPGPQHWVMCDRDADLLERITISNPGAADVVPVKIEKRQCDITRLVAADFAGSHLVTASALLDILTLEQLDRIVAACSGAECPALLTLTVTGSVELTPADPLDTELAAAFNAHQRRNANGRRLLGPDAVAATVAAFADRGVATIVRPSPWRLGPGDAELISQWLAGWLGAACEQRPELTGPARAYQKRRLAEAAQGRLEVVVQHEDVLAV